jgi:hypothetical protein
MGRGFDKPWKVSLIYVGRSKYNGKGIQYTMDRGFDMSWVGGSIFHG